MNEWMIYGANGYTGSLIAREAKRRGLAPILAGRNEKACHALASELGLSARSFSCDSARQIAENLRGVSLVLHCAGPFSSTSVPMLEACISTKTHYLDITGEIPVFENIHTQSERIRQAGIVAIPGVGFDVVPTDGLAAMLKEKLPTATHLSLGFKSSGKVSVGTTKTMIEGLGHGGAIRKNGKIESVPAAYDVRSIRFENEVRTAVTIPWGDICTAFYSTGIPNIQVYLYASPAMIRSMKVASKFRSLLSLGPMQALLKKVAERYVVGPTVDDRSRLHCIIWGEARSEDGKTVEMRMRVPEAYALTVQTALAAALKVDAGEVSAGAWTPSKAFGRDFILGFEGVEILA